MLGDEGWGSSARELRSPGSEEVALSESQRSCPRQRGRGRNAMDSPTLQSPDSPPTGQKQLRDSRIRSLELKPASVSVSPSGKAKTETRSKCQEASGFVPGPCCLNDTAVSILECVSWYTCLRDSFWCMPRNCWGCGPYILWKPPNCFPKTLGGFSMPRCVLEFSLLLVTSKARVLEIFYLLLQTLLLSLFPEAELNELHLSGSQALRPSVW